MSTPNSAASVLFRKLESAQDRIKTCEEGLILLLEEEIDSTARILDKVHHMNGFHNKRLYELRADKASAGIPVAAWAWQVGKTTHWIVSGVRGLVAIQPGEQYGVVSNLSPLMGDRETYQHFISMLETLKETAAANNNRVGRASAET